MMYLKSSTVALVLLAGLLSPAASGRDGGGAGAGGAAPSFEETLRKFEAAVLPPVRAVIYAEETGGVTRNGVPDPARAGFTRLVYKRDGGRLDVTQQDARAGPTGAFTEPGPTYRFVVAPDQSVFRQSSPGGNTVAIAYQDRQVAARRAAWTMLAGRALEGVLDGDGDVGSVAGALRAGRDKRVSVETADFAKGAVVLRSNGRAGAHALWVDPVHFLPLRIEVVRTASDLFNDKPLDPSVAERRIVCDAFESDVFSGRRLPTAVRLTDTTKFTGGDVDQLTVLHRNTQVELQPEFNDPADFAMDMPDGTPVLYEPRVGVNYEWRAGKPAAVVDDAVVAAVNRAVDSVEAWRPSQIVPDGSRDGSPLVLPAVAIDGTSRQFRLYVGAAIAAAFAAAVWLVWQYGRRNVGPRSS